MPRAQPRTAKYCAKNRDEVVERIDRFVLEDDDLISNAHKAILDMLTPLESQGVTSITFKQIQDQLHDDPQFQNIEITDDLISQAVEGISGVNATPDMSNNQQMTITFDDTSSSPESSAQTDKGKNNIDQAAKRQATKDLS